MLVNQRLPRIGLVHSKVIIFGKLKQIIFKIQSALSLVALLLKIANATHQNSVERRFNADI